jgi:hypothetical protein
MRPSTNSVLCATEACGSATRLLNDRAARFDRAPEAGARERVDQAALAGARSAGDYDEAVVAHFTPGQNL